MKRRTKVFSSDRSYILGRTWWVTGDIASRKRQFILTRENPYSSTPVDKWFYKKFEGMIKNENLSDIPVDLRTALWLERLLTLFQEQRQVIQKQAEQIASLKQTVQELRDEVNRLKKLPKRPKFRPGGHPSDPKSSTTQGGSTPARRAVRQRTKKEVLVKAVDVPSSARFKGYQTYTIQELTIIPKDVTYMLNVGYTWSVHYENLRQRLQKRKQRCSVCVKRYGPYMID
jgi:hypothetical protein